jgi:hypothetical protein
MAYRVSERVVDLRRCFLHSQLLPSSTGPFLYDEVDSLEAEGLDDAVGYHLQLKAATVRVRIGAAAASR